MLVSAHVDRNLLQDAGALLSDLPLQLRISWEQRVAQQHHKESHELSEGFVWDYRDVLNKACGWGGLQPDSKAMSWTAYMTQNTRTAVLLPFVSPKNQKWGFKLSYLSDRDIFPVSHPSDRNTELFRRWCSSGPRMESRCVCPEDCSMSLGCGPNTQQSSTVRAGSIFNFVQRIDADVTKNKTTVFTEKVFIFLTLQW